jgi:hypothetical protein
MRKLHFDRMKSKAIAVSLLLLFAMAVTLIALPASGQLPPIFWEGHSKSYAFIGATPNPASVNEEVLLHVGLTKELQTVKDGWEGLKHNDHEARQRC